MYPNLSILVKVILIRLYLISLQVETLTIIIIQHLAHPQNGCKRILKKVGAVLLLSMLILAAMIYTALLSGLNGKGKTQYTAQIAYK
jgi:hypothetical protein